MKKIAWWQPQIGSEEKILITQVLENNFPNEGNLTSKFEQRVTDLLHIKYGVAVTSGTVAIYLSLKALGISYGDEVIVPDITFIATANAVEMCGARPVLVDIEPERMTIDPQAITRAITKNTKAIIPVHVSGRAPNMDAIIEIADANDLCVVEDAAEAFMSKYSGRYLGTIGEVGCFSFSPAKTITTGQGGMIVTNNQEIFLKVKELKDQGRPRRGTGGDDIHYSVGYNFKYTDLQAALGIGQLAYLESRLERMRRNYCLYSERLKETNGIEIFCFKDDEIPQWTDAFVEKRDKLDKYLSSKGIECRRYWLPLHRQKPYSLPNACFPNSTKLSPEALWLPSAFTLCDSDIDFVCDHIKKFFMIR